MPQHLYLLGMILHLHMKNIFMSNKIILALLSLFVSIILKAQLYVSNSETIKVEVSGDLFLAEDLNNNGNITNLTVGGNKSQIVSGMGVIGSLILNKSGGYATSINGMQTITGLLTPTAGTFVAGGYVTLQSNSTTTAYGTSGSAIITGLNIQHYLSSNQRGWRLIGSPFKTDVSLDFLSAASNIDITYDGITNAYGGVSFASAESYLPSTENWLPIGPGGAWVENSSMALFIRGTKGEGITGSGPGWISGSTYYRGRYSPSFVTLSGKGTLNVKDASFTVVANKNNIIANPFAAPISLNAVLAYNAEGFSNVVGYYSVLKGSSDIRKDAGGYETELLSSNDIIIPPMESFVINSNSGTSFTVPTSAITTSSTPSANVPGISNGSNLIFSVSGSDSIYYDKLTIRFDANASTAMGDKYDFIKMQNSNFDLYSIGVDSQMLAYDDRNMGDSGQIIPLGIRSAIQKDFNFTLTNNTGAHVVLKDKLLNQQTDVTDGNNYSFSVTDDMATQGNNRFELVINPKTEVPVIVPKFNINIYPNPSTDIVFVKLPPGNETYNISLLDAYGREIQSTTSSESLVGFSVKLFSSGVYFLKVDKGNKNLITKSFIKD